MAASPAEISRSGNPRKAFGGSAKFRRSRTPAKMQIASVKPSAAEQPKTTLSMKEYPSSMLTSAAPSTAQLVVMSGR